MEATHACFLNFEHRHNSVLIVYLEEDTPSVELQTVASM